jgi:uncharacterized protein (DUF2249 family)
MKIYIVILLILYSVFIEKAQTQNLQWVKQIGDTNGNFFILSSVTDASGNLYTCGVFDGTIDVDPGATTTLLTDAGFGDIFISKMDTAGNFVWARQIGRESYDQGNSIALDASGNIYVSGFFSMDSTDFDPGPGFHYLLNPNSGALSYILKLDPSGNFIWAKELGPDANSPASITLDASENILITGVFGGIVDFDPGPGIYNLTSASNDIYILKLNASGDFVWAKQIDINTTQTRSHSIATDAAGNIFITGHLLGTVDFDPGPGVSNLTATTIFGAAYIMKLDAAGNFAWARVINGNISPSGADRSIRLDAAGNSYTTGWFGGTVDFNPNAGVFNLTNTTNTGPSTYLLKLDASGNFVWAKQIGDPGDGYFRAICLDASNNLYVTGMMQSTSKFNPGNGADTLSIHNGSTFVAKYDANGNYIWALNFSNLKAGSDASVSLNVDVSGNIISTGSFQGSADFDPGPAVFNLTSKSTEDVFIHKLHQYSTTAVFNSTPAQIALILYPNPCKDNFYIETKNPGNYFIVNPAGQILRTFTVNNLYPNNIDISDLPDGIYFVITKSIIQGKMIVVQK